MQGMLSAEGAILVQFQLLSGVSLVLVGVVVALLALGTPKRDLHTVTGFRHNSGTSFKFVADSKKKRRSRSECRFQRCNGVIRPLLRWSRQLCLPMTRRGEGFLCHPVKMA